MSDAKRDLTLLVMTGETSPVRRVRIRRAWFKQAGIAAALFISVLGFAGVDSQRCEVVRPQHTLASQLRRHALVTAQRQVA